MTTLDAILARIAEIEARAKSATRGPWTFCHANSDNECEVQHGAYLLDSVRGDGTDLTFGVLGGETCDAGGREDAESNAIFIAEARDDIPALCAALREAINMIDFESRDEEGQITFDEEPKRIAKALGVEVRA